MLIPLGRVWIRYTLKQKDMRPLIGDLQYPVHFEFSRKVRDEGLRESIIEWIGGFDPLRFDSDVNLRQLDVLTLRQQLSEVIIPERIRSVVFSNDSQQLSILYNTAPINEPIIRQWDTSTGVESIPFAPTIPLEGLLLSSKDRKLLYRDALGYAYLLAIETNTPILIQDFPKVFTFATFTINDEFLMVGDHEDVLHLYQTSSGQSIATIRTSNGISSEPAISQDNQYIAYVGNDQVLYIWDWNTSTLKNFIPSDNANNGRVTSLLFDANTTNIFASTDQGVLYIWSITNPLQSKEVQYKVSDHGIQKLQLGSVDGLIFMITNNGLLLIWDSGNNKLVNFVGLGEQPVLDISLSLNGDLAAILNDKHTISIWKVNSEKR